MITRTDIISKAREYLGTPYHHQGRLKGVGIDCVGLLWGVASELGLPIHNSCDYTRYPTRDGRLVRELSLSLAPYASPAEARPGDVLVFWIAGRSQRPQHTALLTGEGILHCYSDVGRVVEHGLSPWWRERIHSAWSFKGVEDSGFTPRPVIMPPASVSLRVREGCC